MVVLSLLFILDYSYKVCEINLSWVPMVSGETQKSQEIYKIVSAIYGDNSMKKKALSRQNNCLNETRERYTNDVKLGPTPTYYDENIERMPSSKQLNGYGKSVSLLWPNTWLQLYRMTISIEIYIPATSYIIIDFNRVSE